MHRVVADISQWLEQIRDLASDHQRILVLGLHTSVEEPRQALAELSGEYPSIVVADDQGDIAHATVVREVSGTPGAGSGCGGSPAGLRRP